MSQTDARSTDSPDAGTIERDAAPLQKEVSASLAGLREGGSVLALATVTYDQPKEFPAKVKIFVFGVGTGVVDADALASRQATEQALCPQCGKPDCIRQQVMGAPTAAAPIAALENK